MENYLYLLEFFVDSINFSSSVDYPRAVDVRITGTAGNFIKLDVFTVHSNTDDEPRKELRLNSGKSVLFSLTPEDFLKKLDENPFEISVFIRGNYIGSAAVGWTRDFYNLVKQSADSFGIADPVSMKDQFLLKEKETDKIMGDIQASVRLSGFGASIQTTFQLVSEEEEPQKRYLVKGTRDETTFECQKLRNGFSGEILPVTTIFSGAERSPSPSFAPGDEEPFSWMALFKSPVDPKMSVAPEEFNQVLSSMFMQKKMSDITFDIVSLMERPADDKFIDLRIKGGSQGLIFEFDAPRDSEPSVSVSASQDVQEQLTVETINKHLCKNKDCPAVKKFKELGIGPLANTKGLGGLYGEVEPHVTYGMSQTYGVLNEYGPYGLFSRPKRPSSPFIPKQDNEWASSCWKPKRRKNEKNEMCACKKQKHDACFCRGKCRDQPLRLTGGGVLDYDDVKSPFYECKEILDQMDEVLYKYKKALGPCGKTTCPFAPNVTKESCKQMCKHDMDCYSADIPYTCPQEEVCPRPKTKPVQPACGSPKCAYAKYKTGLVDEDAEMELQYMPCSPSGKCGNPKCPYPVETELPPIHWDCPDPLPKGKCKNPECPYLPKEIKCLNAVLAKGPCGNFNCPFAPPDPCSSPYCPFGNKDCPYQKPPSETSICDNPDCPYAEKTDVCDNPECPYASKKDDACPYPNICPPGPCPYALNPYVQLLAYLAMMTGNNDLLKICFGGSDCPYVKQQKQEAARPPQDKKSPPKAGKKPSPCSVPVEGACGNPKCPFAKPVDQSECSENVSRKDETCENPECPYAEPKTCFIKPPPGKPPSDPCQNPECPYAPKQEEDETCDNPECPYAPKKPEPPQVCPAAPPCGIPFPPCGINPLQALLAAAYCMPITICPDGTCPYQLKDMLQICFGECPMMQQQGEPCVIEEKKDDICDNPTCPYVPKKEGDEGCKEIECTTDVRRSVDLTPCTKETCKAEGGDLECTACSYEQYELVPGAIEYKSETRISIDLTPCTKKTCKSTGGKLVCDECPCSQGKSGVETKKKVKSKKGKKKKTNGKYVYSIGDKYPGVQIGHRECILPGANVPPKMGWLWNIHVPCLQLKPRRGWRPGAIAKTIAERIRKHRESQGLQMLELKTLRKGKKGYGQYESGTSINIQPKPTLHIKKHEGCYWITMNPLKDPHTLVENESPYMDCTPLQFKIVKNKDKAKTEDENAEYKSCFCGDEAAQEESSSDSELEIEFTPPAGIIHPERFKKKKNVVHCDTQYLASDFETKSEKGGGKKEKGGKKGKEKGGKKGKKK